MNNKQLVKEKLALFIHRVKFNATRQGIPEYDCLARTVLLERLQLIKELENYIEEEVNG